MKITKWTALLMIAASPACVFASSSDSKIEDAAKDSYNYRTVLNDKVHVKSDNGVVTLTGKVEDRSQKELAEDTVENLPGVVSVHNELRIASDNAEHSDSWIALKIRSKLLVKSNVSATSTKVDVMHGVVVLSGTANNDAQKELTEVYAKEVEGVTAVKNDMVVAEHQTHETAGENVDDASITGQLKYELVSHKATSALKTKVDTDNGVVTITGEADSDAEKALVTKLAESIRGVRSVNNRMSVRN